MGRGEQQGVGPEPHRRVGVAQQARQQDGGEARAARQDQRGEGDVEAAGEKIHVGGGQGLVGLRDHGPQEHERGEKDGGAAHGQGAAGAGAAAIRTVTSLRAASAGSSWTTPD